MKKSCATCGAELPPDGFCVSCLLGLAVGDSTAASATEASAARSETTRSPPAGAVEKAGERIGPYKLLEMIGEGGMGRVWMAEQTEPIRRTVAVKVIKTGLDSAQVLARFEAERQALALMDHPNIARVLDAGATPEGRPYFVMELVKGTHLTKFCEEQRLPIAERLRLFSAVCQAIQHAHQKGIIHRDIKPSNVLVALYDGQPVPKIIDFGVAKATEQLLTDRTLFTQFGAVVGTPEYMSPEQAELNQLDIDTRSDIYSLGVLLYELLTGVTPLRRESLRNIGLQDILRRVREDEAKRPSTILLQSGTDPARISGQRRLEPKQLIATLRGDLDWIVMKALDKQRARRYAMAAGLSADITRFLKGEPIEARPPSNIYRLSKLVRRNRLATVSVSFGLIALLAGLGLSITLLMTERTARKRAREAEVLQITLRKQAESASAKSRQVAGFLKSMLKSVDPHLARGRDTTLLNEVVDRTASEISTNLTAHPDVEAEIRTTLGDVYLELGKFNAAGAMYERALLLRRGLGVDNDGEITTAMKDLAVVRCLVGDWEEAELLTTNALARFRRMAAPPITEMIQGLRSAAVIYIALGESEKAAANAQEALDLAESSPNVTKEVRVYAASTAVQAYLAQGQVIRAEDLAKRLQAFAEKEFPASLYMADAMQQVAACLASQNRYDEALKVSKEAVGLLKSSFPPGHFGIANGLFDLGRYLLATRRLEEAEAVARECLEITRNANETDSRFPAGSIELLVEVLMAQQRQNAAEQIARKQLEWAGTNRSSGDRVFGQAYKALASVLISEKKYPEAERVLDEALVADSKHKLSTIQLLRIRVDLAGRRGLWEPALRDARRLLILNPRSFETCHLLAAILTARQDRQALAELARSFLGYYRHTRNPRIAGRLAKDFLALRIEGADLVALRDMAEAAVVEGQGRPNIHYYHATLGLAEYRLGHHSNALEWTSKVMALYTNKLTPSPSLFAQTRAVIAMANRFLGENRVATNALSNTVVIVQKEKAKRPDGGFGFSWIDWVFSEALMREALQEFMSK